MLYNLKEATEALKEYDNLNKDTIGDIITECADANTDVYTATLKEWAHAGDNLNYVEDAIDAHSWEGVNGTIAGAYAMGQYLRNAELLQEAWEAIKKEED